jgi:hypothetical protein
MRLALIITAVVLLIMTIVVMLLVRGESYSTNVPRIFLSIASLRDDRCKTTLKDAFEKADHPEALVVGVCEQNSDNKHMCLRDPVEKGEVRVVSIPAREATGPVTARERITRLYQDEEIFMQVDAHTTFVQGWDTVVRKAMVNRPSAKSVLTHYPPDSGVLSAKEAEKEAVPVITRLWFTGPNDIMQQATHHAPVGTYAPSRSTAAGFLIMPGSAIREVPYDPGLAHLFQGEELLYGARLYTHGYDLYSPPSNIILHAYGANKNEKGDADPLVDPGRFSEGSAHAWDMLRQTYSGERARHSRDSGKGFGQARPLQEFFAYAGIDPVKQAADEPEEWVRPRRQAYV